MLDNSLIDDGVYLLDNEGEVYLEQLSQQSKTNWGLIGGIGLIGLGVVVGLVVWFWKRKKSKIKT